MISSTTFLKFLTSATKIKFLEEPAGISLRALFSAEKRAKTALSMDMLADFVPRAFDDDRR